MNNAATIEVKNVFIDYYSLKNDFEFDDDLLIELALAPLIDTGLATEFDKETGLEMDWDTAPPLNDVAPAPPAELLLFTVLFCDGRSLGAAIMPNVEAAPTWTAPL